MASLSSSINFHLKYNLFFSESGVICELVHQKKSMRVEYAVEMDRHALNRCISGIWLQCPYVLLLVVEV